MAVTLIQWLHSRTPAQIAAVLTARPDATAPPVPQNLRELAERLEIFGSVAAAAHQLPTPAIEVIEVLQLLGREGGNRTALAGWLGCSPKDPDLDAVLDLLTERVLVWPEADGADGDGAEEGGGPDQVLHMAEPLYATVRHPLRLGPPSATLLATYPAEQLRGIMRALGLPSKTRKDAMVTAITSLHADADRVRELVAGAGRAARAALEKLAADGPPETSFADWYGYYQYQLDPNLRWARERGFVVVAPRGLPQVPREVAVALRGPDWHAPFTPRRPDPPMAEMDGAAVAREAAAAGSAAVEQVTALLEAVGAAPVAMLKAGGVGVKELRRLAKAAGTGSAVGTGSAAGTGEATARLWLEVAYDAHLLAPVRGGTAGQLLPTPAYDQWSGAEPADRLAELLTAWVHLPAAPLLAATDRAAKPPAALIRDHSGQVANAARSQLLNLLASLPAGRAVTDPAGLAPAVCWHSPLSLAPHPDANRFVAAAWQEAQLVGAVAHGALTPIGRALVRAREYEEVVAACRELLPAAVGEAIFQADLTALVPGTPAAPLAALLDAAADRETRGGAVTWRFSAGSVRRALDAGHQPEGLLAALRERAAGGVLPQPLTYLVTDVARRHGAVRAREVACVLRSEDPALLAEIVRARALRPLGLTTIAPTVLGSAAPVAETLAALREAGYAPVAESADGAPVLERAERHRARPPDPRRRLPAPEPDPEPQGTTVDPEALARALLEAPVPPPAPPQRRGATPLADLERQLRDRGFLALPDDPDELDVGAELEELAAHLAPGERRLLAHAIETNQPVEIEYSNARGSGSVRVIEPIALEGAHLVAWCQLRDDERAFSLHRIASVSPA